MLVIFGIILIAISTKGALSKNVGKSLPMLKEFLDDESWNVYKKFFFIAEATFILIYISFLAILIKVGELHGVLLWMSLIIIIYETTLLIMRYHMTLSPKTINEYIHNVKESHNTSLPFEYIEIVAMIILVTNLIFKQGGIL